MDRRLFLRRLGLAAVGGAVAYSFPSIIVPKNIITPAEAAGDTLWKASYLTAKGYRLPYDMAPRGLTYIINYESRILQGVSR